MGDNTKLREPFDTFFDAGAGAAHRFSRLIEDITVVFEGKPTFRSADASALRIHRAVSDVSGMLTLPEARDLRALYLQLLGSYEGGGGCSGRGSLTGNIYGRYLRKLTGKLSDDDRAVFKAELDAETSYGEPSVSCNGPEICS